MMLFLFTSGCWIPDSATIATTSEPKNSSECHSPGDCSGQRICDGQDCNEVSCFTSDDCARGEYCNSQYQCSLGCSTDNDCFSGEKCEVESNTCVEYGCEDQELDCRVGEYCDVSTQTCYADEFPYCDSCSFLEWQGEIENGTCVIYRYDESSYCNWDEGTSTGAGCNDSETCLPLYLLDPLDSSGGFCASIYKFKNCSPGVENTCPRGFSCMADIYNDGSNKNVCISDCDYLIGNGYY